MIGNGPYPVIDVRIRKFDGQVQVFLIRRVMN